jgi:hypothetical protein
MKIFILIVLCINTIGSILALNSDGEEKNKLTQIVALLLAIAGILSIIFMARML